MTLMEALQYTLSFKTADENQTTAQREIVNALQRAMEARRQGIVISQSTVSSVKWAAILLQGLCTLIAIAMVHSDNRMTCAIALTLFATGVAICVLMIAAYTRPFTGEISVGPDLLQQGRAITNAATNFSLTIGLASHARVRCGTPKAKARRDYDHQRRVSMRSSAL